MDNKKSNFCRICGLDQKENPWGKDNNTPNFEICACCGAEFGYNDCNIHAIRKYRNEWLLNNAEWFDSKKKPFNWSLEMQMKNIPEAYL